MPGGNRNVMQVVPGGRLDRAASEACMLRGQACKQGGCERGAGRGRHSPEPGPTATAAAAAAAAATAAATPTHLNLRGLRSPRSDASATAP